MATDTATDRMFATHNDLAVKTRGAIIAQLNQHLADLTDLRNQVKYAHWNLKGPRFIALHKLFDELAEFLDEANDLIAERATALGGVARGTVRQAAAESRLEEMPHDVFGDLAFVRLLAERYASAGKEIRQDIDEATRLGDANTADLYTEISRTLDKHLWFLEAHLQHE